MRAMMSDRTARAQAIMFELRDESTGPRIAERELRAILAVAEPLISRHFRGRYLPVVVSVLAPRWTAYAPTLDALDSLADGLSAFLASPDPAVYLRDRQKGA